MKKVLIIYASAGDGHKKASEAVYDVFSGLKDPSIKAILIDSLNYTTRFFKYSYKVGYMFMIKYIPTLWGFFYYLLDNRFFFLLHRPFRRFINGLNSKRLVRFMIEEDFDIVISTHFMATEVISHLKRKGVISVPLLTVITDFKPHLYWQAKGVDRYIVGSDSAKEELINRAIPAGIIDVLGIPIRKGFANIRSKADARKFLRLPEDSFTILVMGGGFGVGPIEDVVLKLQGLDIDCQVLVVCGHNKRLCKKLNSQKNKFKKPTHIFGFRQDMDRIMAASDIMISKVGGITVAESLVIGLPILCINPIPGQEMNNAKFLFDNNIGFRINSASEVQSLITKYLFSKKKLEELNRAMNRLSKPNAAADISKLAIGMIR